MKNLCKLAIKAAENSYSPYSKYKVGAALLTKSGKIFTGCNIENGAFSPTVCAERVAIFKAVSEGEKEFSSMAVFGENLAYPCGVCRQVLSEFCESDFKILVVESEEKYIEHTLGQLLPKNFSLR